MEKGRAFRLVACAVILTAAVIVPVIQPAGAATQTFEANADARVAKNTPGTNFGTATSLVADRTPAVESYARFAVSGLTGTVEKATLRLYATNGTPNGPSVYQSDPVWSETGINWNNRPARTTGKVANSGSVPANNYLEFDVSSVVTGNGTFSFNLAGDSKDDAVFNSKEAGGNRPQLVITLAAPDTTAPETNITSGPPATVYTSTVSLGFSATEPGATFECRLDTNPFAVCSSPQTYRGLADGTYTFAVRAKDAAGNVDTSPASRTFTVDTTNPGDPILVGAGDISSCSSTGDDITANLLDGIPGTVFTLGDNVYDSGTTAQFNNCYDPTWGRHKERTRPVAGNHDYASSGATPYYNYFGTAAGDPSKGYYSYDLGAWHVIVLNTNCAGVPGGCGAGSPQEQWLRADLAASEANCTVAMFHHPRFSSGSVHGNSALSAAFWTALYEYGAEVVLAGHDHIYERYAPQTPEAAVDFDFGLRQFIVGTGGVGHYGVGARMPNSELINTTTFGLMKLTLHSNSYTWNFVPEPGATFTDSGTGTCHGAPPVTPPPPPPPPGSGPIAFRAASSAGDNTAHGSIRINKPTGTQPGDVMIASVTINDDDPPIVAPPGWTGIRQDAISGSRLMQAVFWRVAGNSEPSFYEFTLTTTRRVTGGISSYSGVDTANPIEAQGGAMNSTGSTSITAPSINVVSPGAMLVHLAAINAEGAIAPPANHTERWEAHAYRTDDTRDALAESSDVIQAAAGATGTRTAIATASGPNIGVLIALRPAG